LEQLQKAKEQFELKKQEHKARKTFLAGMPADETSDLCSLSLSRVSFGPSAIWSPALVRAYADCVPIVLDDQDPAVIDSGADVYVDGNPDRLRKLHATTTVRGIGGVEYPAHQAVNEWPALTSDCDLHYIRMPSEAYNSVSELFLRGAPTVLTTENVKAHSWTLSTNCP